MVINDTLVFQYTNYQRLSQYTINSITNVLQSTTSCTTHTCISNKGKLGSFNASKRVSTALFNCSKIKQFITIRNLTYMYIPYQWRMVHQQQSQPWYTGEYQAPSWTPNFNITTTIKCSIYEYLMDFTSLHLPSSTHR